MLVSLRNGKAGGANSGITLPSVAKKPRGRRTAAAANPRPRVSKAKKTGGRAAATAGPSGASVARRTKKNAKTLNVADRKGAKKASKANVASKKKAVVKVMIADDCYLYSVYMLLKTASHQRNKDKIAESNIL